MMYEQEGNLDKAIEDFTKLIDIDPTDVPYMTRGDAYHAKSKRARTDGDGEGFLKYINLAIYDFEKASEIAPDYAKASYQRMVELLKSERENRGQVYKLL